MATLVYSPGVRIHVESQRHGIIDVSDDVTDGSLTLNQDSPHHLTFTLLNLRRKYDGVFMPNDRVVVKLKRIRWLQVFAGYLNRVPFASVWPNDVSFSASCSLKRLMHTYYDPGAMASVELINSFMDGQGGSEDGHLSARAVGLLTEVAGWNPDAIHISRLPPDWYETVSDLFTEVSPQIQAAAVGGNLMPGGMISGATLGDYTPRGTDGTISFDQAVRLAAQVGWVGDEIIQAAAVMYAESTLRVGIVNSIGATGLFQVLRSAHPHYDPQRLANDALFNATAAFEIWTNAGRKWGNPSGGGNPWEAYGNATYWEAYRGPARQAALAFFATPEGAPYRSGVSGTASPTAASASGARYAAQAAALYAQGQGAPQGNLGALGFTLPPRMVFPVPGSKIVPSKALGVNPQTGREERQGYSDDWGKSRGNGTRTHKGHDIFGREGSPFVAVCDGTIGRVKNTNSGNSGLSIWLNDDHGNRYYYCHNLTNLVREGDRVTAGQVIGTVGRTGNAVNTPAHVHWEFHPAGAGGAVNPHGLLNAMGEVPGAVDASGLGAGNLLSAGLQSASVDDLSLILTGAKVLMNDVPLFQVVKDYMRASMRSFCSAPNGDFIGWFPDYFGAYDETGVMAIEDIELEDFTIDWDDRGFVSHQFVTGSMNGWGGPVAPDEIMSKMMSTMGVASVDFPQILRAFLGDEAEGWTDGDRIMAKFGIRPDSQQVPALITPQSEFFYAVHLFKKSFAEMFNANIPISFMPELWPGMIMRVPSQGIQTYVRQVSHSWSMRDGGGFSTRVEVNAPADLDGKFIGLGLPGLPAPTSAFLERMAGVLGWGPGSVDSSSIFRQGGEAGGGSGGGSGGGRATGPRRNNYDLRGGGPG